eukprot:Gb_10490 [translate_table: standard]
MAQRGLQFTWGRRGKRNVGNRGHVEDELLKRLEALESRFLQEESKDEQLNPRVLVGIIDPMERGKGQMVNRRGNSTTSRGRGSSSKTTKNEELGSSKDMKPNFKGRGRGQPAFGSRKPLRCFIRNEDHKAQDCPLNPQKVTRAMVPQEEIQT